MTLINNNGVTKAPNSRPVIDAAKGITVTVSCLGNSPVQSANDIKNHRKLTIQNGTDLTTTLPVGEAATLELKLK